MRFSSAPIAGVFTTLMFGLAAADDIAVSPAEIANLGIETVAPELAEQVAAIEATARVVVPPAGDSIISAPQPGLLAGLNVAVGDAVVRGQVLGWLQSPEFIALQREFLDALNTHLLAKIDYERDQQLFDEGIISGRRLQETGTRARIATSALNEHRQLLRMAGISDAEIAALGADQEMLQQLEIRAPFDGVILQRLATTGERLDAMSPVYRLAELSVLWLEINVPQEQIHAVRPGMKVAVVESPVPQPAEVTTIGRSINPDTQTIIVRAVLQEVAHELTPGQFVVAQIVAGSSDAGGGSAWEVPVAAVTQRGDSHYVFVRTETGFDVREVRIISADAERAILDGDLDATDQVVAAGIATLKALWAAQSDSDT